MVMSPKLEKTEMSLASYKTVLESVTSHEQSYLPHNNSSSGPKKKSGDV